MLPTKVIFLDFDGVVSTHKYKFHLDPSKVKMVNSICLFASAKIIVSSSWKMGCTDVAHFKDWMEKAFLTQEIRERNREVFDEFLNNIFDITNGVGSMRGDEIRDYLLKHDQIEHYVILDDDSDMLEEQLFNFVQTDTYEGITQREVGLCDTILHGEEVINPIRLNLVLTTAWRNKYRGDKDEINIDALLMKYRNRES